MASSNTPSRDPQRPSGNAPDVDAFDPIRSLAEEDALGILDPQDAAALAAARATSASALLDASREAAESMRSLAQLVDSPSVDELARGRARVLQSVATAAALVGELPQVHPAAAGISSAGAASVGPAPAEHALRLVKPDADDRSDPALELVPSKRVSRVWRAAALAFASAAAVLGTSMFDVSRQVALIEDRLDETGFLAEVQSTLGPSFRTSLFDPGVRHVPMESADGQSEAVLLANARTGVGHIVLNNASVTDGRPLDIVLQDASGRTVRVLGRITAKAGWSDAHVEGLTVDPGLRVAIVDPATGQTLLTTSALHSVLS